MRQPWTRPSSARRQRAGLPARHATGLCSKPPRPTRRCWPHTPRTPRSPPARPRSRAPSTQSSRSSPPCSFPAAELLTAWAGFTTWELLRGSNIVRNLHFMAPLSAALANGDDTLSITADCYSVAAADAAIYNSSLAGLLHLLTLCWETTAQGQRRTRRRPAPSRPRSGLLHLLTSRRAVGRLPHGERAEHADAGGHHGRAAGLPDGPGPDVFTTNQITSALVAHRSAADRTRQRP